MNSKPFYKTWWGIILLFIFWPFSLTYWIWKRNWNLKLRLGLIIPFWLFIILVGLAKPQEQSSNDKNVLGQTSRSSTFGDLNKTEIVQPTSDSFIIPTNIPTIFIISSDAPTSVLPTNTPAAVPTPTIISQKTVETKFTQPKETKAIGPIVLSGTGQQATRKFQLESGLTVIKMTNSGDSNFTIWLIDSEGNKVELLVNEIGSFEGSKAVNIKKQGDYILDIASNSTWEINIEQPRTDTAPETKSFVGTTQSATDLFYAKKGLKIIKMNNAGSGNFTIWLLNKEGDKLELLVNEIGGFNGSKAIKIPTDGVYLFDIVANGNWSIALE